MSFCDGFTTLKMHNTLSAPPPCIAGHTAFAIADVNSTPSFPVLDVSFLSINGY